MAPWFIPALKLVLPHVGTILSAAAPAFTRKGEGAAVPPQLQQRQIAELQAAVSQNAAHVKELAAQLQRTVTALEQGAAQAEARLRRATLLSVAATAVAVLSLAVAAAALYA